MTMNNTKPEPNTEAWRAARIVSTCAHGLHLAEGRLRTRESKAFFGPRIKTKICTYTAAPVILFVLPTASTAPACGGMRERGRLLNTRDRRAAGSQDHTDVSMKVLRDEARGAHRVGSDVDVAALLCLLDGHDPVIAVFIVGR